MKYTISTLALVTLLIVIILLSDTFSKMPEVLNTLLPSNNAEDPLMLTTNVESLSFPSLKNITKTKDKGKIKLKGIIKKNEKGFAEKVNKYSNKVQTIGSKIGNHFKTLIMGS